MRQYLWDKRKGNVMIGACFPLLEKLEYVLLPAEKMTGADVSLVLENELQMMTTLFCV